MQLRRTTIGKQFQVSSLLNTGGDKGSEEE
jgi:hypothetical protein